MAMCKMWGQVTILYYIIVTYNYIIWGRWGQAFNTGALPSGEEVKPLMVELTNLGKSVLG